MQLPVGCIIYRASVLRGGASGLRDGTSGVLRNGVSGLRNGASGLRDGTSGLRVEYEGLTARVGEAGLDRHLLHVWLGHAAQSCHCMQHLPPPVLLEKRGQRDMGLGTAT